jgi:SAM-dependent methyltransferase
MAGGPLAQDSYAARRRRVLFEVWKPGAEQIDFHTQYCTRCGFVCYTPRQEDADWEAYYEFLIENKNPDDIQESQTKNKQRIAYDASNQKRAQQVFKLLSKYTSLQARTILDVGGGIGQLLEPFLKTQCECYLVDYYTETVPGVTRLGNTPGDVPEGMKFDLLICSHVLEHLAKPKDLLREIHSLLKPDGLAYFEVPMEVWGAPLALRDPLTHTNFYHKLSFMNLIRQSHYSVIKCDDGLRMVGTHRTPVVWAIGQPASKPTRLVARKCRGN